MKKTLTAALTTALVVGAASTTFAAANPFSDVPADHWAYDAVAQLADDGIIEGYGDGTYRGQNEITRYEMAQMVAKAMAKEDQANAQQKAMIDKLAAEFSEELNNLGVRVSNLESKIDNVKWTGELQYTYYKHNFESGDRFPNNHGAPQDERQNELLFRLEPEATVNDHWKVMARVDATVDIDKDNPADKKWASKNHEDTDAKVTLKRAYAAGHYGVTDINAGLLPVFTEQGMVLDDNITGAQVVVGADQKFTGTLTAGRIDLSDTKMGDDVGGWMKDNGFTVDQKTGTIWGLNLTWKPTDKISVAGEYYRLTHSQIFKRYNNDDGKTQSIWGIGGSYQFDDNFKASAGYWNNTGFEDTRYYLKDVSKEEPDHRGYSNHAWNVQLDFKGAEPENARTYGLYAAYRYVGQGAAINPTFDGASWGEKGWEIGGQYVFAKNVMGTLLFFSGNRIRDIEDGTHHRDNGVSKLFGRLEYFF
ncbi:putative porin [Selenomonas sputigena]|uniref:Porin n=1 Tax=Selenomonas sputigena TaxID=69823 RepID=A0ABV3X424_9FIRM